MFIRYIAESFGYSLLIVFLSYWIIERVIKKHKNNNKHVVAVFVSVVLSLSVLICLVDLTEHKYVKLLSTILMTIIFYFIYRFKKDAV